ncbi:TIGR03751 family conjugal transfer lipoprotein [Xenorhabdus griffiniae]|uniref:TIGR03751 family conjugal transfer lipoprotein n=1 Tax=Xenorhabdus griffiniae TaxID=351672 RepID=A0ABY9XEV2_9GAMM|nr:TIGR03751 family conjugal transfer lipoprotein [Xenorhabdus griffiniae]MBD1226005.1 TIGR03751 family conjugal transfer lipoprotein [Xenorhabdus griffiniae]MBE8585877.1 TIGR03751 family conjugal transfer lipoprotein [Xenorhabdus griffiniae]WMV71423.1 TIGR03751 family conjugal transfer lipoprotein [Xenorhabdus griffiniae]WNH01100.1 TIGR03751 family conjugal transfer lipoprotein [Xenorhabdus griffiniae]
MKLKTFTVLFFASTLLMGCVTSKEKLMPAGEHNMIEIWQGKAGIKASSGQLIQQARNTQLRPLEMYGQENKMMLPDTYSRTQETEISQQFPRLPNPDMVMYVFPHLSQGNLPVPGYSTVFSFYQQVQYAMPGERVETL